MLMLGSSLDIRSHRMVYVKPLIRPRRDVVNYTRIHSAGARAQARAHIMRVRGAQGIRGYSGIMCIG